MLKGKVCVLASIILVVFAGFAKAEITYVPLKKTPHSIWNSDSLFLGAEVAVNDSTKPVVATWKTNRGDATGKLYFMVPGAGDSAKFLFHNHIAKFAGESLAVNLGYFPRGTKLYFMYIVTDTSQKFGAAKDKKLFSGQNRSGTDQFISERKGLVDFRWALAGKVTADTCETSFGSVIKSDFWQIRYYLSNTYLVK
jgi:hypothetical protein